MISYAQNAEDAVLARLFTADTGTYIDIGAGHPVDDSVTKHFYDRGWRGVNVEPMRGMYDMLCEQRPEDVNVHAALSDRDGTITLYEAPEGNLGASTVDPDVVKTYGDDGRRFTPVDVEAITFETLAARHAIDGADFVKIDVEGHETAVVRSVDWTTLRPRAVVIEAVTPNSQHQSHDAWEGVLLEAGYICTLFDGVNRFYARSDDAQARATLSTPANVFDDIEPWRWVSQIQGAKEHIANVEQARTIAERYAQELSQAAGRATKPRRVFRRNR